MIRFFTLRAKRTIASVAFGLLATLGAASAASATTLSCPDSPVTGQRIFTVSYGPVGGACFKTSLDYPFSTNINGSSSTNGTVDPIIIHEGFSFLDADNNSDGLLNGALNITRDDTSGLSGTFSISAPGYTNLLLGFKSGKNIDPVWAVFELAAGVTSGRWTISQNALSHAILYGTPASVPLPATLPLLAAGLGIIGLASRRKRA